MGKTCHRSSSKLSAQAIGDLFAGGGVDLKAHRIAFATIVQLLTNAFQEGSAFFILHIEIAVAGHPEGAGD